MTGKEALEILNIAWSGRMDRDDYPNFDDINEALYQLGQDLKRLEELEKENLYLQEQNKTLKEIVQINKQIETCSLELIKENIKIKKIIEILKDKIEFEDLGEMQSGNMYRGYFNDCLDEEEVKSVKEVFENDK